jgi:hypothetical protein
VLGHSDSYFGVYGHSDTGTGVRGDGYGSPAAVSGYNYGTGHGGYFYASSGNALYASGSARVTQDLTVNGEITTDRVNYSVPRTHYASVAGEAFQPRYDVSYGAGGGMGGAYLTSGSGQMVASVQLPHGAVVTSFRVYFYDASSADMSVSLSGVRLNAGGYYTLASVGSSGTSGYYSVLDTTISYNTVNNTSFGYEITAHSTAWSSSLKIMGAVITYTLDEAP